MLSMILGLSTWNTQWTPHIQHNETFPPRGTST